MLDSKSKMMDEFKAMVGLQIGVLVTYLLVGCGIAVFSHQHILGVLPASEWSPIIGWILAAVVGYVVGGVIVGVTFIIGFFWIFSD